MSGGAWFETIASRRVFEGFSRVRVDDVRTPDGEVVEREVVEHTDAVVVIAVNRDDEVVLVRQYRQAVGSYLLEAPAGKLDVDGEPSADAVRRELREEAHHDVGELTHLTTVWNSAGWCDERTHVFLGENAVPTDPPADFTAHAEEAHLEVVRLPLTDAVDAVHDGVITDAKTVIGVLLAAARRSR